MRRPFDFASGVLVALAPLPLVAGAALQGAAGWTRSPWALLAAVTSSLALAAASLALTRRPALGRGLVVVGLGAGLALGLEVLVRAPLLTLLAVVGTWWALITVYSTSGARGGRGGVAAAMPESPARRARGAALAAIVVWLVAVQGGADADAGIVRAMGVSVLVAALLAVHWLLQQGGRHPRRAAALALGCAVFILGLALGPWPWSRRVQLAVILPLVALLALPRARADGPEQVDWWEPIVDHPARLLVVTFLGLCLGGGLLLALPACATQGASLGLLDATFTAVSAVCVTGLTVLDTPTDFSPLGQLVILLLIQAGGLGIMTFSTAAMRLFGRRLSLRHEGVVAGLMSAEDRSQLFAATLRLLRFTLVCEAAGALLLAWRFWAHGQGWLPAAWNGLFTAVSAFCNAGFALQSDNLVPFQRDPAVLHAVAGLIVLGGLSPVVFVRAVQLARGRAITGAAQVKVSLAATAVLLVGGTIALAVIEWHGALGGLSPWHRLHNAWLHSVTTRTAGFNSVDMLAFRPASVTLMMVLMFIGGCPGGTAGGIKTTTAALLLLAVVAAIRGHGLVEVAGRRVPHRSIYRAAAVATLGLLGVLGGLLILQLTQALEPVTALFEVVSALGTVGLTIGGTGALDAVGKVAIIACMYAGRVGPLTLFMFLSQRRMPATWRRPEEEIDVG